MRNVAALLGLLMLHLPVPASANREVELLGQMESVAFDEIKSAYIASSVNALLKSCTVASKVDSIPTVSYKGVRVTRPDGTIVEAHIFPDSRNTYMVKVFTKKGDRVELHGKYTDHAYPLISMLEMRK